MVSSTLENLRVRPISGKEYVFSDVPASMTVREFKKLIADEIQVKPELQKLIISGKVIEDDNTLESYNIQSGWWIRIVQQTAPSLPTDAGPAPTLPTLFFSDLQGKSITLSDVSIKTTILGLKMKVQEKRDELDPRFIRMIYGGKELEDCK